MNLCRSCGCDFGSVAAFDAHRVGRHAYTYSEGARMEPPREDGRRCLNADEMTALEMTQDVRGRWRLSAKPDGPWFLTGAPRPTRRPAGRNARLGRAA